MAKIEKILKKWETKPKEVSKDDVLSVLKRYGFEIDQKPGSHIVVSHEKLIDQPGYGQLGILTIPSKNGRTVKGWYVQDALKAINIVRDSEETL